MIKTTALLIHIILFLILSTPLKTSAATLCLPDMSGKSGTVVDIPINVDDAAGITGLQFCVNYDCQVLDCTGVVAGDLTSEWDITSGPGYDSCQLCIVVKNSSLTPLPSTSGSLVNLQCNVVGYPGAQTDACLNTMVLSDELGNKISVTDCGCSVFITTVDSIDDIQDFFDNSADTGNLTGSGPTPTSAAGKMKALRNMLEETENLIESGMITKACKQLEDAYKKTDGIAPPPDFVNGPAAIQLATMIHNLMDGLGCK
jgi:hypothetical protein